MSGDGAVAQQGPECLTVPPKCPRDDILILNEDVDTARLQLGTGRGDQCGLSCDVQSANAGIEPKAG